MWCIILVGGVVCGGAEDRGKRLFIKNTGPCEDVKLRYTD